MFGSNDGEKLPWLILSYILVFGINRKVTKFDFIIKLFEKAFLF